VRRRGPLLAEHQREIVRNLLGHPESDVRLPAKNEIRTTYEYGLRPGGDFPGVLVGAGAHRDADARHLAGTHTRWAVDPQRADELLKVLRRTSPLARRSWTRIIKNPLRSA
jgi:hypothetical protein